MQTSTRQSNFTTRDTRTTTDARCTSTLCSCPRSVLHPEYARLIRSPSPVPRSGLVCQFALSNTRKRYLATTQHRHSPRHALHTPSHLRISPYRAHDDINTTPLTQFDLHTWAPASATITTTACHVTASEWCKRPVTAADTLPPRQWLYRKCTVPRWSPARSRASQRRRHALVGAL